MNGDNNIFTILLVLPACTVVVLCWVIANITYVEFEIIEIPWIIQLALYITFFSTGFGLGFKSGGT